MSASEQNNQAASSSTASQGISDAWRGKHLGRFQLLDLLGRGAMGSVFLAFDTTLKRNVALKVLPKKQKTTERTYRQEQFLREARSAARLEHPSVVRVYEVGQASGYHFIAMELVTGGTVQNWIKTNGPASRMQACLWGSQAAEALHAGHLKGVIHRDVKPSNLMLNEDMDCKLGDFGLAHLEDPDDPFRLKSETVGTPYYMSPEVINGTPATKQSDIYSLAATLWYILCARPPFKAKTPEEVFELHRTAPVPDLNAQRSDLPGGLVNAIYRALQKEPSKRFESADEFATLLRAHSLGMTGQIAAAELRHAHKIPMAKSSTPAPETAAPASSDLDRSDSGRPQTPQPSQGGGVANRGAAEPRQPAPTPKVTGSARVPADSSNGRSGTARQMPTPSVQGASQSVSRSSVVAGDSDRSQAGRSRSSRSRSTGLSRRSLTGKSQNKLAKNQPWLIWVILLVLALLVVAIPAILITVSALRGDGDLPDAPDGDTPAPTTIESPIDFVTQAKASPDAAGMIHLGMSLDPDQHTISGTWQRMGDGELRASKATPAIIATQLNLPDRYEVSGVYAVVRTGQPVALSFIIPLQNGQRARLVLSSQFSGFSQIDGQQLSDGNASRTAMEWESGKRHPFRLVVDRTGSQLAVAVFRGDEPDPVYQFAAESSRFGFDLEKVPADRNVGLMVSCDQKTTVRIEDLYYRPL